jgi:transcriptional regulator with XRE-family HTH domain
MPSPQLPNYLRSNRKRLALSQDDVAFLLGGESGTQISRYENFSRVPSLETALACEAIFKRPVSEIFGGLYQKSEREVAERARILATKTDWSTSRRDAHKREALAELAAINQ